VTLLWFWTQPWKTVMRPEKLQEIAMRYAPVGIHIRYKRLIKPKRKKMNHLVPAHAHLFKEEMLAPRPVTREKLYVFLHECGHFTLRHFPPSWATNPVHKKLYTRPEAAHQPTHVQEYEAEQFAIQTMRREGIPVPRTMLASAKKYVRECIKADLKKARRRKKLMKIEPRIEEWANK